VITFTAYDGCAAGPTQCSFTVHVTSVSSDEALGSGDFACDGNGNASVRARRDGNGNGRVYHVNFVATDDNGNACEGSVELCVPHDQGRHSQCIDDGQNYHLDSDCGDDKNGSSVAGNGSAAAKGTNKDAIDLKVTQLSQGVAQVEYTLPTEARMTLSVYTVAGRRIATIVEGVQPAGTRSARWVPTNPMPTVYFVQLRSGDQSVVKRVFFLNR